MIVAEGSEENLDLLLAVANKFDIQITKHSSELINNYLEKGRDLSRKAYLPWTESDDEKLEMFYVAGKQVKEMCRVFERNEGAIRSRIKKLQLFEKYGKI